MKKQYVEMFKTGLIICVLFLAGCTRNSAANPTQTAATSVELDIFSGRPNPTWTLSTQQVLELGELLASLDTSPAPAEHFGGLGYRGFTIQLIAPQSLTSSTVYAYGGFIEITDAGGKTTYVDPGKRIEQWLLETGRPYIDGEVYEQIRREIDV